MFKNSLLWKSWPLAVPVLYLGPYFNPFVHCVPIEIHVANMSRNAAHSAKPNRDCIHVQGTATDTHQDLVHFNRFIAHQAPFSHRRHLRRREHTVRLLKRLCGSSLILCRLLMTAAVMKSHMDRWPRTRSLGEHPPRFHAAYVGVSTSSAALSAGLGTSPPGAALPGLPRPTLTMLRGMFLGLIRFGVGFCLGRTRRVEIFFFFFFSLLLSKSIGCPLTEPVIHLKDLDLELWISWEFWGALCFLKFQVTNIKPRISGSLFLPTSGAFLESQV